MAHHLLAFSNGAVPNGSVLTDITAVQDGWASIQNNHFLTPADSRLIAAAVVGATVNRSRIVSPTLRAIILPNITPLNVGALVATTMPFSKYGHTNALIRKIDELEVDIAQGGAGAERDSAFLWLSDGNWNIPPGDIYTARATATITGVTGSWVNGSMTLDAGLPAGRYSCVGMAAVGTNLGAARLAPITAGRRPGCLGQTTAAIVPDQFFRFGHMGEWLQFEHTAMPTLDVFALGANTAQEIFLDLIKIG